MSFNFGDEEISNVEMGAYSDNDIPSNHNVVAASMDDWELPNQVVTLEVE